MTATRRRRVLMTALAALSLATAAAATTVIAKSFRQLAVEADGVFAATVTDVASYRRDDGAIRTAVRFGELRWLAAPARGAAGDEKELTFAGGRVGEVAELVGGMPQFRVGQRVVIFYRDTDAASPIVGFHQGCFGVRGAAGEETVFTADHLPVVGIEDGEVVSGNLEQPGMSLDDFSAAVTRLRDGVGE